MDGIDETRAQVREAKRASLRASLLRGCVLHTHALGVTAPPHLLEELEIQARLRWTMADELKRIARR